MHLCLIPLLIERATSQKIGGMQSKNIEYSQKIGGMQSKNIEYSQKIGQTLKYLPDGGSGRQAHTLKYLPDGGSGRQAHTLKYLPDGGSGRQAQRSGPDLDFPLVSTVQACYE
jgi:hypothetical protein